MNTINKFFRWYFSRNALPYWAVLAFDTFVVLFSGLVCYALDHGPSSTTKVFWPLLGTLCFYLLFFIIGFRQQIMKPMRAELEIPAADMDGYGITVLDLI